MSFRREVRDFIAEEKASAKIIAVLREENEALRKQVEGLFNKLMARSFEEYAIYKTETEVPDLPKELDLFEDESLAGDIVDETEQSEYPGSIS